jgi:hypothetical protein
VNRLITGVVALAATAGIGLASMGAASASPVPASPAPVVYQAFGTFAHPTMIRPGSMVLGTRWGFQRASWQHWNGASAYGNATEWAAAGAAGPEYRWPVRVTFSDVRHHDGRAYYSKLKLAGTPPRGAARQGVKSVTHLVYRSVGGWFQV